jgi:ATP-dependent helicase/nuclease subunit B
MPPLRLRLKLADLVRQLIDGDPGLAPRAAIYPLADSLADLMGEMFEERVTPETIAGLDMGSQSGHWARSQAVLGVVETFFGEDAALTAEARQARLVDRLARQWRRRRRITRSSSPGPPGRAARRAADGRGVAPAAGGGPAARARPGHAGRGLGAADRRAAQARARRRGSPAIPPGAGGRSDGVLRPVPIPEWAPVAGPASAARNRSCRWPCGPRRSPTSGARRGRSCRVWMEALRHVTYLEAPNPQTEATAIALGLRHAAENGHRAALVSPDRNLTRQVAAALDRWNITPDDSAGEPLGLTPPGRFLRMVAQALSGPLTSEALVALLSHPLCHSGVDRGDHLRFSREFELEALRGKVAFPDAGHGAGLGRRPPGGPGTSRGLGRLGGRGRCWAARPGRCPSRICVAAQVAMAEALAAGPGQDGAGGLYDEDAGDAARMLIDDLRAEAGSAAP